MMMDQIDQTASLCTAVAAEIRGLRAELEKLAGLLVCDEHFVSDYIDQFQAFDHMAQTADESASVLERLAEGQAPAEAVARVRLTEIQQRLSAAIGD
jgi:hypothetical protein